MPRISKRQQYLEDAEQQILISALLQQLEDSSSDKHAELQERIDEAVDLSNLINSRRYLRQRMPQPKSRELRQLLNEWSDDDFRQITRVNKYTFEIILEKIWRHPVFSNNSRNSQTAVAVQLQVALERLGCNGNGASVGRVARKHGVFYLHVSLLMDQVSAGSAFNFTRRIIKALLSLEHDEIAWPRAAKRRALSEHMDQKYGLRGCVGMVDGTHNPFSQRPAIDGETFFNRKNSYSLNTQVVCTHAYEIIYYAVGWPGSCHDASIWATTALHRRPDTFLGANQYLLGDSAYPLSTKMLTPYKRPLADIPRNAEFNDRFSSARVTIEHVYGQLKSRWASLTGIRTQVN
jgi:hypothetical protein